MMNNDLQIEVSWFMNENMAGELHFNYFDKEGNMVGNIIVDAFGNMRWEIFNLAYRDYLSSIINYIYVGDLNNNISFESKDMNGLRWTRARIYIEKHGLLINYHHPYEVFEENNNYIR